MALFNFLLNLSLLVTSSNWSLETVGINVLLVQLQKIQIESKRFLRSLSWCLKVFMASTCLKMVKE